MKAEIIGVGTELLLGDVVDTNSAFLAKEMAKLGIDVFYKTQVGDNIFRLKEVINTAQSRSDLIIFTGGLGPTEDDLTKQALCDFLQIPLLENPQEVKRLSEYFQVRNHKMSRNNLRQALIPQGALILKNPIGTASGILLTHSDKHYILLPGPPSEMKHIFLNEVIPWLKKNILRNKEYILSHTLKFIGISESRLEQELLDLFQKQSNPTLALLAKNGEIHCRLTAKVKSREHFSSLIKPIKEEILKRVGKYCYGTDDLTIEEVVGRQLKEKKLTLVTAESCTGGLIAKRLTDIPGSSEFFLGSVVAYSNLVKETLLEVPAEILNKYGAVSEETALAMAQGVRKILQGDLALSITGNAGPQGGTEQKPVGLVYISLVGQNINVCKKYIFSGTRQDIRWRAATNALNLVRRSLDDIESFRS